MRVFLSSLSILFVHSCLYTSRTTKSLALPPYLLPSLALPVSPARPRCPSACPFALPPPSSPSAPLPAFPSACSTPRLLFSLTLKVRKLCPPPTTQSSHGQRNQWTTHDRPTALLEQSSSATSFPTNHCPAQFRNSPNRTLLNTRTIYLHPPSGPTST